MADSVVEREAERRASEVQLHLQDAAEAVARRDPATGLALDGALEHAILRQMLGDAIRWGMEHQRELQATADAVDDATLESAEDPKG